MRRMARRMHHMLMPYVMHMQDGSATDCSAVFMYMDGRWVVSLAVSHPYMHANLLPFFSLCLYGKVVCYPGSRIAKNGWIRISHPRQSAHTQIFHVAFQRAPRYGLQPTP